MSSLDLHYHIFFGDRAYPLDCRGRKSSVGVVTISSLFPTVLSIPERDIQSFHNEEAYGVEKTMD
jgi:hypothetical protein